MTTMEKLEELIYVGFKGAILDWFLEQKKQEATGKK